MEKMVFINLPVTDLKRSTTFYEKLGFKKNEMFSDDHASSLNWSDSITIMLLTRDFYQKFIQNREIINPHKQSGALIAFSMDSKDDVDNFGRIAKENGGDFYHLDMGIPEDQMYGLEVLDPDGNQLEPSWMNM